MSPGRLIGIARKPRPRADAEAIDHAAVGIDTGIAGDFRGAIRPGRSRRRQLTIMAAEDWAATLQALGAPVAWQLRRVNLLSQGIVLPRERGARLRIGDVLIEITGECDPCRRMEAVAIGLEAALTPDWRGGRTATVIQGGAIAVGDQIQIQQIGE